MSVVSTPRRTPPPPGQPYYYGWRDVHRALPDGSTRHERIPLTLEDALHPQEGDFIMEGSLHDLLRTYLADVARARLAADPRAEVLSNCGVYWHHPDFDHHAPDVALVFGVRGKVLNRPSFDVVKEGVRPRWIFELVSPNTRKNDVETKLEQYHQVDVPYYVIFDREDDDADWTLVGYQWTPAGYLGLNTDARGRLWIDCLNLWVGVDGQKIICYDAVTDEPIGDYTALTQFLEQARRRAQAEAARADTETARADTEATRADTEAARADTEATRADTEAARAAAAETRVRELEAELQRRSPGDV